VEADEIVFTGGGTESNALAILGGLAAAKDKSGPFLFSAVEHPSITKLSERIESEGRPVVRIPVNRDGFLDEDFLVGALRKTPRPALVSVMFVGNETGTIFPVGRIALRCRESGVLFHVDAVQGAGKTPGLLAEETGADLISLSAHKLGGLQGTGAVVVRKGSAPRPVLGAGPQERGLRGGTENLPGIVAFGIAADHWRKSGGEIRARLSALGERFQEIISRLEGASLLAAKAPRIPSIATVRFEGVSGEGLLQALDLAGVSVSLGAACASGSLEPSPVLLAMGYSREEAKSSVRFSFGWSTQESDLTALAGILPAELERLRGVARRYAGRTA
ncbi:MAG: cysteine desulfurase family protein, partial [Bdellovibrionota bacterium]